MDCLGFNVHHKNVVKFRHVQFSIMSSCIDKFINIILIECFLSLLLHSGVYASFGLGQGEFGSF